MCEYKKHKHGKLKEVHFIPTHAEHERAEGKAYERKEHMKVPRDTLPKTAPMVRDQWDEGVERMNKGSSNLSLMKVHKFK